MTSLKIILSTYIAIIMLFISFAYAQKTVPDSSTIQPIDYNTYESISKIYVIDTSPNIYWLGANSVKTSLSHFNFLSSPNKICKKGFIPNVTFKIGNVNSNYHECPINYFHYELDTSLGHSAILQEGNAYRIYYSKNTRLSSCGTWQDDNIAANYILYCVRSN